MAKKYDKWELVDKKELEEREESSPFGSSMGSPASDFVQESTAGTMGDVATVIPQAMTLEFADELIGQFSPDLAQDYREAVKAARKNSPTATTIAELFTPDVLDLVTAGAGKARKMEKIIGILRNAGRGAAESATTSAIHQMGSTGDVNAPETLLAAGMGGALRGAGGAISDVKKGRKKYMGAEPEDFVVKSKGVINADDYLNEVIGDLETKGLFKAGKVEFDPKSGSWFNLEGKTSVGDKVKGKIIPPSQKEILSRIEQAKKHIANETTSLVSGKSGIGNEGFMGSIPDMDIQSGKAVRSGNAGAFAREDFSEGIEDFMSELPFESVAQEKRIRKMVDHQMTRLFGEGVGSEVTLIDIHEFRKFLDSAVKYDRKGNATEPMKEQAFKNLASAFRDTVGDALAGSGKLEALNKQYGDLATLTSGLEKKVLKGGKGKFKAGLMAGNLGYKAASAIEALGDTMAGVASQMSRSVQESPARMLLSRGVRKLAPVMSSQSPESPIIREPQSVTPMEAAERMEMNLPKQLIHAKMPRNSEGVKENAKILKLKVAQDATNMVKREMMKMGEDPSTVTDEELTTRAEGLYKNFAMVLDETPEEIPSILPIWVQQFPELFEKDRYGRIEGVVPDSRRPEAREEIRKNSQISNIERIKQLDLLNRSGEYNVD